LASSFHNLVEPFLPTCFTVPIGATHKKNAEALMNYYYDPVNAAELAAWVNYITPVAGAYDEAVKIDPALAENNLIFPSEEFLSLTQRIPCTKPGGRADILYRLAACTSGRIGGHRVRSQRRRPRASWNPERISRFRSN
jgi:hypothetical protein